MPITHFLTWIHWIKKKLSVHHQPINTFDITIFLRQFAVLLAAGVPIIQSCDILEKSQEKIALRALINTIKNELLAGKNLFSSLRHYPQFFNDLICQLIQIGEHTGKLDQMLSMLADHEEKALALQKKIKQTLFYPCIILIMACIVTISMFIFIIPKFAELFANAHEKLPSLTRGIFYLSIQLKQYFVPLSLLFLALFIFLFRFHSVLPIKLFFKKMFFSLPMIKSGLHKNRLARFARNTAITFAAGIPITDSLKLMIPCDQKSEFAIALAALRNKIYSGVQLHYAMEKIAYFPPFMIHMVKVGEESGTLEYMLEKIADFFESDIERLLSRFSQLLEPLLMIVLGVLIGGLVIGMYLPLFNLGSLN